MSYRIGMSLLIVLCGLLVATLAARGHDEMLAQTNQEKQVFEFYRTWMRPDGGYGVNHRYQSCCNKTDCFPVGEIRKERGIYIVRLRYPNGELSQEYSVRTEVIESGQVDPRESPDGRSHACVIGGMVVCFVEGSDG